MKIIFIILIMLLISTSAYSQFTGGVGDGYDAKSGIIALYAPKLISPDTDRFTTDIIIPFKWNTSLNCTSYQFQLSNNDSFTQIVKDTIKSDTTHIVYNLSRGNTYYWRVCGIVGSDTTGWSDARTITIEHFQAKRIGNQIWMTKNLDLSFYKNGQPIPNVTNNASWSNLTTGAWCNYNHSDSLGKIYGKLYNWYAVADTNGLAPTGWRVPSDSDWDTLVIFNGGAGVAASKLKQTGNSYWKFDNSDATNSSGFTALPGGIRWGDGSITNINYFGYWWSSTPNGSSVAWNRDMAYNRTNVARYQNSVKFGFSVRCVRDTIVRPTLATPANQSNKIDFTAINFKWNKIGDALSYRIQISRLNTFTSTTNDTIVTDTSFIYSSTLNYNSDYFWRVNSMNEADTSVWSTVWQFTTNGKAATINTTNLSKLLSKSFVSGGNIISDGGYPITSKGICYNLTGNPTTDDFITNNGTGSASFTSYISGLTPNTNYFVRAYATNEAGTAYGNELNFKTTNIDIPLGSGWNLISSNYKHSEPDSMQYIWANNSDKLVITKNNAGSVYIPQFGINSIGKWDVTQGYQVYMSAADTLGITGEQVVPAETGISLKSGWNMIAYLRNSAMEAPLAFASITDNGNLVIAKNISGQVYIPSFGINSIGNLVPGQGYRVYVTNNDTLVYPDN